MKRGMRVRNKKTGVTGRIKKIGVYTITIRRDPQYVEQIGCSTADVWVGKAENWEPATICLSCREDYQEDDCLTDGYCPDCLDNAGDLEDALEMALGNGGEL